MNIVALIPARAGSKRIPQKNIKRLGGKPLIQWTIEAARESGIFGEHVWVVTDDKATADIAAPYAQIFMRSAETATDSAPDILWVREVLRSSITFDAFAILRPTSPFRSADAIRCAVAKFGVNQPADSLRSVRQVTEHPGKMWMCQREQRIVPLLPYWTRTGDSRTDSPWHSTPTQRLPIVHVQTAGLEVAWRKTVTDTGTIAGTNIIPFSLTDWEGFDINTPEDWDRAERYVADLQAHPAAQ